MKKFFTGLIILGSSLAFASTALAASPTVTNPNVSNITSTSAKATSLPDLVAITGSIPGKIEKNTPVTFIATIKNIGGLGVEEYYKHDRFEITTGPNGEGAHSYGTWYSYGKESFSPAIGVNGTYNITTLVTLSELTPFANVNVFSIRTCADYKLEVSESNELNNCSAWSTFTIGGEAVATTTTSFPESLPDLKITSITSENKQVLVGVKNKFTWVTKNDGTKDLTSRDNWAESLEIREGPNGTGKLNTDFPVRSMNGKNMKIGSTITNYYSYLKFAKAGQYSAQVCVDNYFAGEEHRKDGGTVKELNEDNNCSDWVNFEVVTSKTASTNATSINSLTGLPDLKITSITSENSQVLVGVKNKFTWVVKNDGTKDLTSKDYWTESLEIREGLNGTGKLNTDFPVGSMSGKNMKIGSTITNYYSYLKFAKAGQYSAQVCVDNYFPGEDHRKDGGAVKELSENNNCSDWVNFEVVGYPNLTATFNNTTYTPNVMGHIGATITKTGPVTPNTKFYNRIDISTKSNSVQAWFSDFKSYKITANTKDFSGDTMKVLYPWKFKEGYTGVRFCADQGNYTNNKGLNKVNQIKESSETDNCTNWVKFTSSSTDGGTSGTNNSN